MKRGGKGGHLADGQIFPPLSCIRPIRRFASSLARARSGAVREPDIQGVLAKKVSHFFLLPPSVMTRVHVPV